MNAKHADFLVIGGGIAGLTFALRVADFSSVRLIAKDEFDVCSTQYAQGGINAVLGDEDSFAAHARDTMRCGYGLCNPAVVELVVNRGPAMIDYLREQGVAFTREGGRYSLHREGGHDHNRVVHARDATGAEIMRALVEKVTDHPNIEIEMHHVAIDLIIEYEIGSKTLTDGARALGAYVLDAKTNQVHAMTGGIVYLATGGIGKVYPYTSNPKTATGDGIVMAYRSGIEVVNMEFIQFHPTLLFHERVHKFLISEALRGHGGILRNAQGEAFMARYDQERRDLAPRDVVARAIDSELKRTATECAYLDMTHLSPQGVMEHFPTIYKTLKDLNIDITKEPIPVVPGAHYVCGGIKVDIHGRTRCRGLFAGGECAFTGLHGANRLASNSLLEAAVFAEQSANWLNANRSDIGGKPKHVAPWVYHNYSDEHEESLVNPLWDEVKRFMWTYVGIVRSDKRLQRAMGRIGFLRKEIEDSYWDFRITQDLIELRNISVIAELIIRSAVMRKESRGLHFSVDHPNANPEMAIDTVIMRSIHGLFR